VSHQEACETNISFYGREFYKMMMNGSFLPAGNTLVATEKKIHPNCAIYGDICEDTIDTKRVTSLWSHSIGLGFQFDKCRDPVQVLQQLSMINASIDVGHRPQRGNFGTLSWDHPQIIDFITCKNENPDELYNFNISITLDKHFWTRYKNNDHTTHHLMSLISNGIHTTGDPGILFIDNLDLNEHVEDIEPPLGSLSTLVPCGEQTMYTNETCNLGSINVNSPFFCENDMFHFERFTQTIHNSVRFLDNVIDLLDIPDKQMDQRTKQLRRIGLGVSGFADLLYKNNIRYGSDRSYEFAKKLSKTLSQEARRANKSLADEKGSNAVHNDLRNQTITCLPPTGGISLLWGNQGFSIEPSFTEALTITPTEHIKMVDIWQQSVDNCISKTINVPHDTTPDDISNIIEQAYDHNLRCVTIYRDQSRMNQPCLTC
jgi:ribonucleoside-diphosphate reductase alpha chain